ncbi:uncharacterized protein I206_100691 [Kwoniella pini CBS 10737]|uniref:Uncharacterized protein n=1 Tax=Kwoniella pini CBS 10737 TaxID=1296096 RepID=A0A1B9ICJ6_9TREE|nr:uncharacterized protein I206_00634 [Kwoniella pini CBS 10737]OCF53332.1 hypothetical protein I206_00634 [Kwoniella pini CBS 10737]
MPKKVSRTTITINESNGDESRPSDQSKSSRWNDPRLRTNRRQGSTLTSAAPTALPFGNDVNPPRGRIHSISRLAPDVKTAIHPTERPPHHPSRRASRSRPAGNGYPVTQANPPSQHTLHGRRSSFSSQQPSQPQALESRSSFSTHLPSATQPQGIPTRSSRSVSRGPSCDRHDGQCSLETTPAGHKVLVHRSASQDKRREHRNEESHSPPSVSELSSRRARSSSRATNLPPSQQGLTEVLMANERRRDSGHPTGQKVYHPGENGRYDRTAQNTGLYVVDGSRGRAGDIHRVSSTRSNARQHSSRQTPRPDQKFDPSKMSIACFRRVTNHLSEKQDRETCDVRPIWTYSNKEELLLTSPYHFRLTNKEGISRWRMRCPHTDGKSKNPSEECRILHVDMDLSAVSLVPKRSDNSVDYSAYILPSNQSISMTNNGDQSGCQYDDLQYQRLEEKIEDNEVIQKAMKKRYVEWSKTRQGRSRLNTEAVYKNLLNQYQLKQRKLEDLRRELSFDDKVRSGPEIMSSKKEERATLSDIQNRVYTISQDSKSFGERVSTSYQNSMQSLNYPSIIYPDRKPNSQLLSRLMRLEEYVKDLGFRDLNGLNSKLMDTLARDSASGTSACNRNDAPRIVKLNVPGDTDQTYTNGEKVVNETNPYSLAISLAGESDKVAREIVSRVKSLILDTERDQENTKRNVDTLKGATDLANMTQRNLDSLENSLVQERKGQFDEQEREIRGLKENLNLLEESLFG